MYNGTIFHVNWCMCVGRQEREKKRGRAEGEKEER